MSFTSKNLNHPSKSGMTFFKGATLFFLGMSAVMFLTQAFEIVPSVKNAKQYIQEIIFTIDGYGDSLPTVTIDGASGNASFSGTVTGAVFCLEGDDCIIERPEGGVSGGFTGDNGKRCIYSGASEQVECFQNAPSGIGGESVWMTGSTGVAYYNDGNVGIGTDEPTEKFQVSDYLQIGDDGITSLSTGGNFLRIKSIYVDGLGFVGGENIPAYTRNPNIQLNRKSGMLQGDDKNRKIENNGTLKFDYATGSYDYDTKLSLSSTGLMTLDGNIKLQTGGYIKSASNANQLYLDYNGRVGIGTATPSEKLEVSGTGKFGDRLYLSSILAIGSYITAAGTRPLNFVVNDINIMTMNQLGNVGIGTGTPQAKLHVAGTGKFDDGIKVGNNLDMYSNSTYSNINSTNNGLLINSSTMYIGTNHVGINSFGNSNYALDIAGSLQATTGKFLNGLIVDGNVGIGKNPSYKLDVAGTGNFSSGLIVNGNVGIGTDTPQATLHVKTPTGTTGRVALFEAGGSTAGQMEINGGEQSQMVIRTMKAGTDLTFATHLTGAGNYNANQLYLNDDGNVGIGKSPSAKLDVNGGIKAIRNLTDPCTTESSNYPEGTMFYVGSHPVTLPIVGTITLPDMYCFCDNTATARPINGMLIMGTAGGSITASLGSCF